jgi:hypothetical protein
MVNFWNFPSISLHSLLANFSKKTESETTVVSKNDHLTSRLAYFEAIGLIIGCVISTVDLTILGYLQWKRKGSSFDFLLAISILSVVT